MNLKSIAISLAATVAFTAVADRELADSLSSITSRINASGVISVKHPQALELRLRRDANAAKPGAIDHDDTAGGGATTLPAKKSGGYRVQIFSDNNARTAKSEAQSKARAIADAFPQYPTYVVYTSPYWRLKVGDFKSQEEAEVAATEIKRKFPSYAREIRVVRDRINR